MGAPSIEETARTTTREDFQINLTTQRDRRVRLALLINPALCDAALAILARDRDPEIAALAEDRLAGEVPGTERLARAAHEAVPLGRMTTLAEIPGFSTTTSLGLVSSLTSNAGWTAASKGNTALEDGYRALGVHAGAMGANAVVGVTASTFGAGGGITNMLGGDAVGVLLIGTAVVVRVASELEGPEPLA